MFTKIGCIAYNDDMPALKIVNMSCWSVEPGEYPMQLDKSLNFTNHPYASLWIAHVQRTLQ